MNHLKKRKLTLNILVKASLITTPVFHLSSVVSRAKLLKVTPSENGWPGFVTASSYRIWTSRIFSWTFFIICVASFSTKESSGFGRSGKIKNEIFSVRINCEKSYLFQLLSFWLLQLEAVPDVFRPVILHLPYQDCIQPKTRFFNMYINYASYMIKIF